MAKELDGISGELEGGIGSCDAHRTIPQPADGQGAEPGRNREFSSLGVSEAFPGPGPLAPRSARGRPRPFT